MKLALVLACAYTLCADTITINTTTDCDDGIIGVTECTNGLIAAEANGFAALADDRSNFFAFATAGTSAFRAPIDDIGSPREPANSLAFASVHFELQTFGPERMGIIDLALHRQETGFANLQFVPQQSGQFSFPLGILFSGNVDAFGEGIFDGIRSRSLNPGGSASLNFSLFEADGTTPVQLYFGDEAAVPEPSHFLLLAVTLTAIIARRATLRSSST